MDPGNLQFSELHRGRFRAVLFMACATAQSIKKPACGGHNHASGLSGNMVALLLLTQQAAWNYTRTLIKRIGGIIKFSR
jgi:hypothetical protein